MMRFSKSAAAALLVVLGTACGSAPPPAAPATDDPSFSAPLDRASQVADQLNQREADLESMLQDLDP